MTARSNACVSRYIALARHRTSHVTGGLHLLEAEGLTWCDTEGVYVLVFHLHVVLDAYIIGL